MRQGKERESEVNVVMAEGGQTGTSSASVAFTLPESWKQRKSHKTPESLSILLERVDLVVEKEETEF